eukprot:SAG31_NODE_320_length_17748_cov_4.201881_1_plen_168_part_00
MRILRTDGMVSFAPCSFCRKRAASCALHHRWCELTILADAHCLHSVSNEMERCVACPDELFYPTVHANRLQEFIDPAIPDSASCATKDVFRTLAETVDIFLIYHHSDARPRAKSDAIMAEWATALPPGHVLPVSNPKACVDVMLGVLAITSGSRELDLWRVKLSETT